MWSKGHKAQGQPEGIDTEASEDLQARINELEAELAEREANEGMSDDVIQLRRVLVAAKAKIIEQADLIKQLSTPPFPYATVVSISSEEGEKYRGRQVMIIADRRKLGFVGMTGVIRSSDPDSDGEVTVQLSDGQASYFGVGIRGSRNDAMEVRFLDATFRTVVLVLSGQLQEVELPEDLASKIEPGDTVKLNPKSGAIVDVVGKLPHGEIARAVGMIDSTTCEIEHMEAKRIVYLTAGVDDVEQGDRLVLDASGLVVINNLGKEEESFKLQQATNVSWENIGGLDEAKAEMREAIELPEQQAHLFRHYRKKPIKGILLYGPPGCGKTMLAKAAATSIAKLHGQGSASTGFLYIKGPEILTRWVGESESAIRSLFQRARDHKAKHGYPAIIFIDEAESILRKRGTGISSDIEATIVPMFLAEMDGLDDTGAIVILATNRADTLDPAVIRDGRIDRKIRVSRPNQQNALAIFKLHMNNVPFEATTIDQAAQYACEQLFAAHHLLYQVTISGKAGQEVKPFTLAQIVNGGLIAGIVDQATSIAMRRDMESGQRTGLRLDDIKQAVQKVHRQNVDLNHTDDLDDFVQGFEDRVMSVRRVFQTAA